MEGDPPPKRRWWRLLPARLSLRALMALMVLLGGMLGWRNQPGQAAGRGHPPGLPAGGQLGYDYNYIAERGNYPPARAADPPAPRWLLRWLGPEYFRRVNFVSLAEFTPAKLRPVPDLAFLDGLPDVVALDLGATRFPEAELARCPSAPAHPAPGQGQLAGRRGAGPAGGQPSCGSWTSPIRGSRTPGWCTCRGCPGCGTSTWGA